MSATYGGEIQHLRAVDVLLNSQYDLKEVDAEQSCPLQHPRLHLPICPSALLPQKGQEWQRSGSETGIV
jgi:hypothetical protein